MSIPQKPPSAQIVNVAGNYPDKMPRLSSDVLSRVPALANWQQLFDAWWFEFRTVLMREREELRGPISASVTNLTNFQNETTAKFTELSADLSELQAQLAAIVAEQGVQNAEIDALRAELTQLQNDQLANDRKIFYFLSPQRVWEMPHGKGKYPTSHRLMVKLPASSTYFAWTGQVEDVDINKSKAEYAANYEGFAILGFR